MRAPALWLIAAGHGSALLVVSAVMVHFVTDVTERLGFSLRRPRNRGADDGGSDRGQLGGGFAGDRFSKRAIVVGCMAAHAVALFVLASATALWMVVVFAVLHGLAWGVRGPLMAALRADYFGSASFGMITASPRWWS
jgi:MFS family permease